MMKKENKYSIKTLFSESLIQKKVSQTAKRISRDFKDKKPLVIAVLNGSFIFCSDLIRKLDSKFAVDFISLSSYEGVISKGKVKVVSNLKENIKNRDVIIVEDIVDSGETLDFLLKELKPKKPKSITVCALLDKKEARVKEIPVKYSCFEVGNEFVVGYGLDYNGFFRGLPYIGILKK